MQKHTDRSRSACTDEQIIELYWNRDEYAIELTDKKYGRLIFSIANNILHDNLDSEECRNDTYLRVWSAIPPTRPTVFSAFISKIVRNLAMDKYRAKTGKRHIPPELTVSTEDICASVGETLTPEEELEADCLGELINTWLRGLCERDRFVFIGRFFMEEQVGTIAHELRVTSSAVYRTLDRLRTELKAYLESNGVNV